MPFIYSGAPGGVSAARAALYAFIRSVVIIALQMVLTSSSSADQSSAGRISFLEIERLSSTPSSLITVAGGMATQTVVNYLKKIFKKIFTKVLKKELQKPSDSEEHKNQSK